MSVVKSKRTKGKMEVITKAHDLAEHTVRICSNEKNFPKRYRWCITAKVVDSAIRFLGFTYRLTPSGRVILRMNKDKISHERRKLKKQIARAIEGKMTYKAVNDCFRSWKAHANNGDSYKLIGMMNKFYKRLVIKNG